MTRGMAQVPMSNAKHHPSSHPNGGHSAPPAEPPGLILPPRFSRRALVAGAIGAAALTHPGVVRARAVGDPIGDRLRAMTLTQKVAQLFVLPVWGTTMTPDYATYLTAIQPGGVLFVGGNIGAVTDVGPFVAAIHATNPTVRPLVALDQEGGPVTRLPGDPTPGAVVLGQLLDWHVRDYGLARAEFLRGFGVDVNFAPVADVAYAPDSFMADRSFGPDPKIVARKVKALVRGSEATRLINAAKHFPGHGRTAVDSHLALPEVNVSRAEWLETDALPFRAAVDAGVEVVMLGHLRYTQWDVLPASLSPVAIDILRDDLGFSGVVATDDLGMDALAGYDPFAAAELALVAGADQLLYVRLPVAPEALIAHLIAAVEQGRIAESRIDTSVRRVLAMKLR